MNTPVKNTAVIQPVDNSVDNAPGSLLKESVAMGVTFADFALPGAIHAALAKMNYETPTKIQAMAIPFALQGRDILGSAQTGTGKTAAFSIPMVARLMENPSAMALVLAPTRELAAQTLDVVRKITNGQRDMKAALLIGGEGMGKQFDQLRQNPRIIIGTPGRINDHLRRNPKMLRNVNFVAIDEADRMLDMGFAPQIDEVLACVNKERQTLLFSATFPEEIIRFSKKYLNSPERVAVSAVKANAPKIKHEMIRIADSEKYGGLVDQLELRQGSVLIFVKTQHGTERLAKRLDNDNLPSIVIHGGLRQAQRDRAVREFRQQRSRILIATDVASRGLDIPHIEHVINYDLPQVAEDYIHRIGRTGRNGAEGHAMCFVIPSELGKWNAINRILNPGAAPERKERSESGRGSQSRGQRPPRGNGERNYKNASGFNNRKPKGNHFEGRPQSRDGGRYESRNVDRSERQDFRDGDFRDNRGTDRDFRAAPPRGTKRTPTDRHWNAKEGRKEYKSDFRNDTRSDSRGEYRPIPRRGDHLEGNRFAEHSERRPATRRDENRGPYRGARNDNASSEGRNYNAGRGDGYEGQDRNSFGVKPRNGAPAGKTKKAAAGKKPFVFKGHSRKAGSQRSTSSR